MANFTADAVPPNRGAVGILLFYAAVPVVLGIGVGSGLGLVPGAVAFVVGLGTGVPAVRGLRRVRTEHVAPDAVTFDATGVTARVDGREPLHVPWAQVRRLDAGAGSDRGWLRMWLVQGVWVEAVERLPKRRRTHEGAVLVIRFGPGADREAMREAVRSQAPQGVRTRL